MLFVGVINTYDGKIILDKDKIISRKEDSYLHGYGLKNIESAVKFYKGDFMVEYNSEEFIAKAMMFL